MREKASKKLTFWPKAAVAVSVCFLLFIYAPLELFVTNQLEFWFTAGQLLPHALGLFALGLALLLLVFFALRRFAPALCPWAVALGLLVLVCCWIQGSFLVAHLPGMNGAAVDATNAASRTNAHLSFNAKGYFMVGRAANENVFFWKTTGITTTTVYTTEIN